MPRTIWARVVAFSIALLVTSSVSSAASTAAAVGSPKYGAQPAAPMYATRSLAGWATVQTPRAWKMARYRGLPATVDFPILFFSTRQLGPGCTSGPSRPACTGHNWFAPRWRTPSNGMISLWGHLEYPGTPHLLAHFHGHRTVIDRRPAKVWRGAATRSCPPGAERELDARIREYRRSRPGWVFYLTTCLGSEAPKLTKDQVSHMLHSLRVQQ